MVRGELWHAPCPLPSSTDTSFGTESIVALYDLRLYGEDHNTGLRKDTPPPRRRHLFFDSRRHGKVLSPSPLANRGAQSRVCPQRPKEVSSPGDFPTLSPSDVAQQCY
jgi:hypothetical protein